jgi:prepilin-type N-terminal cleavage/methylation domain-containing protein
MPARRASVSLCPPERAISRPRFAARPAFSLVELIVVILIVSLVISIIVPALGAARDAARTASSQTLVTQLATAAESFRLDRQRYPGYFSNSAMGNQENGGTDLVTSQVPDIPGLTAAENVMLDLAGSEAIFDEPAGDRVRVTPFETLAIGAETDEIYVNPALLASGTNSYFTPSGEFYEAQTIDYSNRRFGAKQVSAPNVGHSAGEGEPQLPDLVDAFGTPLLVWSADRDAVSSVELAESFAHRHSSRTQANGGPALLSWNSNAGFLRATALGRKNRDMTVSPLEKDAASLIGIGALSDLGGGNQETWALMGAFFGSSAYPDEETLRDNNDYYQDLYPRQPRGDFIVHSAGADGIYFSSKDRPVNQYLSGRGFDRGSGQFNLRYGIIFASPTMSPGERWLDDAGKPTSIDFAGEFDDILSSTN